MTEGSISLRGVFTPVVTSFDQAGDVAHDKMAANLAKWNQTGLRGYIVLGSNGEWVYLDEQERRAVLENTRRAIPSDKLMVAGTDAISRDEADARYILANADNVVGASFRLRGLNDPLEDGEVARKKYHDDNLGANLNATWNFDGTGTGNPGSGNGLRCRASAPQQT